MSDSTSESTMEPKRGLNYRVLLLIVGLAVIYQTFNYLLPENEDEMSPIDYVFTTSILTCAIASFIVSTRYGRSAVLGQAYLALGIAFTAYAIGDIIYVFQTTVLKIDPYTSIADIFFFAQYPL